MKTTLITALIMAATTTMASANAEIQTLYETFQEIEANVESTVEEIENASNEFYASYWKMQYDYSNDVVVEHWKDKEHTARYKFYGERNAHDATKLVLESTEVAFDSVNAKIAVAEAKERTVFGSVIAESISNGTYVGTHVDVGQGYFTHDGSTEGNLLTVDGVKLTGKWHNKTLDGYNVKIESSNANRAALNSLIDTVNHRAYSEGYQDGYNDGFEDGFNEGWTQAIASVK